MSGIHLGMPAYYGGHTFLRRGFLGSGWHFVTAFKGHAYVSSATWRPRPGNRTLRRELRRKFPMRSRMIAPPPAQARREGSE